MYWWIFFRWSIIWVLVCLFGPMLMGLSTLQALAFFSITYVMPFGGAFCAHMVAWSETKDY